MSNLPIHNIIPSPVSGYELPKNWFVIEPKPAVNLVTNPSFERSLIGWSGYTNTERNAVTSYRGGYSVRLWGDGTTAAADCRIDSTITGLQAGDTVDILKEVRREYPDAQAWAKFQLDNLDTEVNISST